MGNHGPSVSCCGILTSLFGITEMNERIKELAEQCTSWSEGSTWTSREVFDKEKFAELIVRECLDAVGDGPMQRPEIQRIKAKFGVEYYEPIEKAFRS
jgi:hypothetical protein